MTQSPSDRDAPSGLGDLPIQPTGSGVADLEIAYEQMALADDVERMPDADIVRVEDGAAAAESEAHPS